MHLDEILVILGKREGGIGGADSAESIGGGDNGVARREELGRGLISQSVTMKRCMEGAFRYRKLTMTPWSHKVLPRR